MLFELLGEAVLGWMFADLVSGLTHYVGDTWTDVPLVKWLVTFNVDHHAKPLAIVNESFWKRNATTFPATFVVAGLLYVVWGLTPFVITAAAGGLLVTEVHRWTHAPSKAPRWVRSLQRVGVFQSPKEHAKHHRPPHELNFCLLTDFCNPVIDAFRGVAR